MDRQYYEDPEFMAELGRELGIEVERIDRAKVLTGGLSGAQICAVYIHDAQGKVHLAVLKVSEKEQDLVADVDGARLLKGSWLGCFTPQFVCCVSVGEGRSCAVSAFAGGNTTSVGSLLDAMREDQDAARKMLRRVVDVYVQQMLQPRQRKTLSHHALMKAMLTPDLLKKFDDFDWSGAGINPNVGHVLVVDRLCPNPLFTLSRPEIWKDTFPISIAWEPLHGDLNADNLFLPKHDDFVLIDFEKARIGLPLYDVAFLLMWLVQKMHLDKKSADHSAMELAKRLARAFKDPASYCPTDDTASVDAAVKEILLPLSTLADRANKAKITGPEWLHTSAALALATASLARSFYELRSAERASEDPCQSRSVHRRNGLFYYAISSLFIDLADTVSSEKAGYEDFTLPTSYRRPSTATTPELYQPALALPVHCDTVARRSFATRLIWRIPLRLPVTVSELAGWRRFTKVEQYSFFSKCRIETNATLARLTDDVLVWADHEAVRLPLVFELDRQLLTTTRKLRCKDGPPDLRLVNVDLIPTLSGRMAWLGLRFEGGSCSLRQYLTWLSTRSFGKLAFVDSRKATPSVTLGRVIDEIRASLADQRRPDISAEGAAPTGEQPEFFQFLLSPRWPAAGPEIASLAWRLLCTASRPRTGYPKDAAQRLEPWVPEHVEGSAWYGAVPKGATVWADGGNSFNAQTKPSVFGKAEYLLWVIAQTMRHLRRSDDDIMELSESLEEVRGRALQYFWKATRPDL